jgi:hypothetical protein
MRRGVSRHGISDTISGNGSGNGIPVKKEA